MSARPEIADDPQVQPDAALQLDRLDGDEARQPARAAARVAQLSPRSATHWCDEPTASPLSSKSWRAA